MENSTMFSFDDIFGEELGMELSVLAPKKEEKKEEKTATKKKAEKKEQKKDTSKVALPCKVVAASFSTTVEGEGEISGTELLKKLAEAGYVEVNSNENKLLVPASVKQTAYIVSESYGVITDTETLVDLENDKKVVFAYGMEKVELDLTCMESTLTDSEVTLGDVAEKITESFPRYKGMDFSYDPESGIICLHISNKFDLTDKDKLSYPCTVMVSGEEVLKMEGPETVGALLKELTASFAVPNLTVKLAKTGADNVYVLHFTAVGKTISATEKANAGAVAKKKEEKFNLPLTVNVIYASYKEELKPENFDGKEKITKTDVIEYFKGKGFALFSNEKMTSKCNCIYDKGLNLLSVEFSAGIRGWVSSDWRYEEVEHYAVPHISEVNQFVQLISGSSTTEGREIIIDCGDRLDLCNLFSNAHQYFVHDEKELKAAGLKRKIPMPVLEAVISFFRTYLPMEAICRVVYDTHTHTYYMQKPEQVQANCCTVAALKWPMLSATETVAMEIHSHNIMPAFWSATDNEAEMGNIGIFGVIGALDTNAPKMKFRAVYMDKTMDLHPAELFTV